MIGPRSALSVLKDNLRRWRFGRRTAAFERLARARASVPGSGPRRALVLTAANVGSLGDEAMLLAAGRALRQRGVERLTLISYGPGEPWRAEGDYEATLDLGTGYYTDFWDACQRFLGRCTDADRFLILGADMMDGYYSPWECLRRSTLARIAAAAGLDVTIGGFSFNPTPHPWTVDALGSLPAAIKLVARDPVSWRRLDQRLGRPVDLGADLAFLLDAADEAAGLSDLEQWLATARAAGHRLLGVNVNYLVAPGRQQRDVGPEFCTAMARELALLLGEHPDLKLVLLPHDYRPMAGRHDDQALLVQIRERMPADLSASIRLVETRLGAAQAKRICGLLDLVFTGRMHLAIAALGQGVPAGGMVYQGKFEGLYEHFGLEGMMFSPERLDEPGAVAAYLRGLLARREELGQQIAARVAAVRALAATNLDRRDIGAGEPS
jgi:polysaccharide pyruvyl transferase WcaK-like protein